uniref:Nitric oxide synthase-interacting protein zinc-finger domain-containing protein n=1 Tax=Pyramimonas obovata TaxID=1411642 RepID=A0A7S0R794_9CHLO|mmetsp:Transcript_27177/g.59395  ORF Transcript_27177/g.59395 Transcript_27177/m.59395 type:complete len:310 (+) Transcript_27177:157-1086(+)|eukprot:CAMPEP_0118924526 /NCGR_PEP_ID=MMETSP1169-20130426/2622_1 /TAXON_ID=36882 /ORGANISM="Pyramimonas obovata, Strain CCMP722" /LENGTH=309 /DNA_ID=CAMNT_0006865649 /DNA_START=121 /DNA_END=1050 /DNA_ORIENTATION=-
MGGGSRHSKNAGNMGREGMSYHERRALGFGTQKERLGKDTVKDFDACGLTLTYAKDPVTTPEGYLYSKESILECLVSQKKSVARQLAAWEDQEASRAAEEQNKEVEEQESKLVAFHRQNHSAGKWEDLHPSEARGGEGGATTATATEFERQQKKEMKAYWLPSKAPAAKKYLDKPDTFTKCPQTGNKLRLKDLVDVKWTKASEDLGKDKAMCPTCKKVFSNITRIVVLKTTGDAMCAECCSRFVEKEGNYNGKTVKKRDIIHLQRGGSGFAASGTQVEAKRFEHLGVGSGLADIRGQCAGPRSAFGLRY